jgi:hypothetical protein
VPTEVISVLDEPANCHSVSASAHDERRPTAATSLPAALRGSSNNATENNVSEA